MTLLRCGTLYVHKGQSYLRRTRPTAGNVQNSLLLFSHTSVFPRKESNIGAITKTTRTHSIGIATSLWNTHTAWFFIYILALERKTYSNNDRGNVSGEEVLSRIQRWDDLVHFLLGKKKQKIMGRGTRNLIRQFVNPIRVLGRRIPGSPLPLLKLCRPWMSLYNMGLYNIVLSYNACNLIGYVNM